MGNVAASGGYWVSMSSDEVIAGSSNHYWIDWCLRNFPTADRVMDKIGVHTAGTTTTWLADSFNPLRPMNPRFGEGIQMGIENTYQQFITKTAAARKTTPEKIDAVATRSWTGEQTKERGLVDRLGSYQDALEIGRHPREIAIAAIAWLTLSVSHQI